ncbi:MAG: GtrA family protein [Oscillospiraceae bacterium]|nr:GtrA family protein [Oscillospiraceae bacterium]
MNIKELWQRFVKGFFTKETLIYLIVGLTNTAIGWIETYIYNNFFHWGYWTTSVVVFCIGLIFTFVLNRKYTFQSDEPLSKLLPKYLLEVLICFVTAYGLGKVILDWFFSNVWAPNISADMLNTVKGILANCAYIALNYIGQKFFVFRKKKD